MASILAAGITQAASSTFTLAAGESKTVYLTAVGAPIADDATAQIQIASAAGDYTTLGALTRAVPSCVVQAVGTFRVLRWPCSTPVGIEAN